MSILQVVLLGTVLGILTGMVIGYVRSQQK